VNTKQERYIHNGNITQNNKQTPIWQNEAKPKRE